MSNIAYLTCELKSRDLDSRLLLAAHLLKRGFEVIVGQQWGIFANISSAPSGVFLFKSANKVQANEMARCKVAGHAVITADEEMLAAADREDILRGTHPDTIELSDAYLFQSQCQEQVLREAYPRVRGVTTGNLRVDLLSRFRAVYERDSAALRAPGKYILFNTNFTMTNSIWGNTERAVSIAEKAGALETESDKATMAGRIECERLSREHLLGLIDWMTREVKDYRIVIRPHPAENAAAWEGVPGIEVVVGSNPIPWINGSDLVVHSNCTTGLEAMLLGRPCINVNPVPAAGLVTQFVAQVNYTAASAIKAARAILTFLKTGKGPIVDFNPPLDFYPPGAAERVADEIFKVALSLPPTPRKATWDGVGRTDIQRAKFTVSKDEVEDRVALIGNCLGLSNVNITALDDSLFLMRLLSRP